MGAPHGFHDLVLPEDQASLADLEFAATQIVDGFMAGGHRSKMKGGCTEFAEHRAYSPGDEVRLLDWRVYAKSDRYYIKQFDEETNLNAILVLDTSGSMGFRLDNPSKFAYGRAACAVLARLLLGQRDPVGLAISHLAEPTYIPPRSTATHFHLFLNHLSKATASGPTNLVPTLDEMVRRVRHRGVFLLFTDAFVDVPALEQKLRVIRGRGHQVVLFHIMAPEELDFAFSASSRFQCLEVNDYHLDLDPVVVRDQYLSGLQTYLDQLKAACIGCGCDYLPLTTHEPLGETLANYLRKRSRQSNFVRTR